MQQRFLSVMHAIEQGQIAHITGLWLIHGDDPLVLSWLIDACRPLFKAHAQTIKRFDLTAPKIWQDVLAELDSLSLFADNSAVLIAGKQKCDEPTLQALQAFSEAVKAGQSGHCLIYQLPKQDKKAQKSKLYQTFSNFGTVVDCQIYHEKDRREVLMYHTKRLGLALSNDAWQFLLTHTENHLLSAHQALWRASDLYKSSPNEPITLQADDLLAVLVSDYQYSVFNLCDMLLAGNAQKTLHILHHLRQVDTAPSVILWGIAKEIRQVLALQSGKSATELGIWQSKLELYHQAQRRNCIHVKHLSSIYEIDKSIKGVTPDNSWQALERLCLAVCGVL